MGIGTFFKFLLSLGLFLTGEGIAHACPMEVKALHSDQLHSLNTCSIYDRYQVAIEKLLKSKIQPLRTKAVLAPRFINLPDWLNKRDQSAWTIYNPAPDTWGQWQAGVAVVDQAAAINFANHRLPQLTLDWLKQVDATTMNGLIGSAGNFRTGLELGLSLSRNSAPTKEQIEGISASEFRQIAHSDQPLVSYTGTICWEEQSSEVIQKYLLRNRMHPIFDKSQWPLVDPQTFYMAADGVSRQCGYINYADPSEVSPQLDQWLRFINTSTSTWGSDHPQTDPIQVAAKAQRWLIAIHPYERGNGRMSRFVMDWLLESVGLPAPLLTDMDNDIYSTPQKWSQEVGNGVIRALGFAEACADFPQGPGCDEIPLTPPAPATATVPTNAQKGVQP